MDQEQTYKPLLSERLILWVFRPTRESGIPDELELPDGFSDEIVSRVFTELSLRDRMALLFAGRLCVTTYTATENTIGNTLHRGTGLQVATTGKTPRIRPGSRGPVDLGIKA